MTGTLLDRFRLDGRAAIVTAASRGIGAATARALAEMGADVVVAARGAEALDEVAADIAALGRKAEVVAADLSDVAAMPALVERCRAAFGRVDVVVNNLGGAYPRPFLDTSPRFLEEALHFNVTTAFALTKAAVPALLEGGGGSVVNITSALGRLRERGYLAYATAKGALAHMTRQMAADLAPRIRVNAVAPGAVETEALAGFLTAEVRTTMESLTPLGRLATPEDIALAVLYLVSDAGGYLTGKVLEVDGGIEAANLPLGLPDLAPAAADGEPAP
ncbi:MAG: glucose 1-dehydrogenase [Actinobacteria bacterium]|nr:glucose 1-dehydrogenase [Actinomycetota bacterium]